MTLRVNDPVLEPSRSARGSLPAQHGERRVQLELARVHARSPPRRERDRTFHETRQGDLRIAGARGRVHDPPVLRGAGPVADRRPTRSAAPTAGSTARGPPRGDHGGHEATSPRTRGTTVKVRGSVGLTPTRTLAMSRDRPRPTSEAEPEAQADETQRPGRAPSQDVRAAGAQGHPHADLAGPLAHDVGDEAVEAQGGEAEGDGGEGHEQPRDDAVAGQASKKARCRVFTS